MPDKSEHKPILSICLTCRDGREDGYEDARGGSILNVIPNIGRIEKTESPEFELRGLRCMSQCKRSCILSNCAN